MVLLARQHSRLQSTAWLRTGAFLSIWILAAAPVSALENASAAPLPSDVDSPFTAKQVDPRAVDPYDGAVLQLDFDPAAYRAISQVHKPVIRNFPVSVDETLTLELTEFSVTDSSTKFVRGTANGDVPVAKPDVKLYRGIVAGDPESLVYVGMSPTGSNGVIVHQGREFILASGDPASTRAATQHVIYNRFAVDMTPDEPWRCLTDDLEHPFGRDPEEFMAPRGGGCTLYQIDVAVETDFEYRQMFGSSAAAEAYILELFGAITTFYERDVQTALLVTWTRVWDSNTDPYGSSGDVGTRLTEFRSHWASTMGSVSRDIAHMLSGKGGGGIAYVAKLCSTSFGYGVSGSLNGSFPNPIQDPHGLNWDLVVSSHELGHNCGTHHTHCYSPPIDQCWNTEGGCWSGARVCTQGTIMSYCHLCFGGVGNIDLNFHPTVIGVIAPYIQGRFCIGCAEVVISDETPDRGSTIGDLPDITISFNQPVLNVTAGLLTVNGSSATMLTGSGSGPYVFSGYATPPVGIVTVVMSSGSIIGEGTGQGFAGDSWTYELVEDCNGNNILDSLETPTVLWRNTSTETGTLDTTAPVAQDLHLGATGVAYLTDFQVMYRSTGSSPGTMMVRFYDGHLLDQTVPQPGGLIAEYDAGQLARTFANFEILSFNIDPFLTATHNLWMEVEITQHAGVTLRVDPPTTGSSHGLVYDRNAQDFLAGPLYMNMRVDGVLCTPDCNGNSTPDDQETDTDGDNLIDACDACPNDPAKLDTGECGCGQPETDTDGDQAPDCVDDCPADPNVVTIQDESDVQANCNDSVDNDCDGLTDGDDPGCGVPTCTCGDADESGGPVDLNDFLVFAGCFGLDPAGSPPCTCADLDGDNAVDLIDFLIFAGLLNSTSTNTPPNCP